MVWNFSILKFNLDIKKAEPKLRLCGFRKDYFLNLASTRLF
ncbi:hypothetical protein CAMGR0001_2623 [Campylobacter gracilis RM3268]|uniref:Uncharacterized protein n=1 Tax=Campylobacter gracilis RM3268 TaxID=553220 RepID=C8PEY2_9BACT|nr:hypothetical protein CAMGR0001_2623 [Campylobacter gracilis RM3268]